MKILVINPGATSTKIAVFDEDQQLYKLGIDHSAEELNQFDRVIDQADCRKTAILGAIAGAAVMAVFSVPSNYFITYPAYVQFYHMPLEAILGMYQAILPSADSLIKCLVIFNMPFTLVKGLLDAVLCLLIYKPLSPILHGRK